MGGNESRACGKDQNVRAPFAPSSEPRYLDWETALATALPSFENGMHVDSLRRPGLFPISLDRVLIEYLLGNPRLQPAANVEYYHAACYGAFVIAGSAFELRKLVAAACVTDGITPAFGQRLDAVVHSVEAIDDGHRVRLAYLCKKWDTPMYNGDTFASTSSDRCNFNNARPGREAAAPRATFTKDVTKDARKGNAKAEAPAADKAKRWGYGPSHVTWARAGYMEKSIFMAANPMHRQRRQQGGSQCGGRAYETTNSRAAADGCYCCCIIGERSGDREEGECIIRISSLPTGSPATSSLCMSSMGSP
eukprot:jgi/Tetstr1/441577/TSEL_029806.t1